MNRTIKFRAWDGKQFAYTGNLFCNPGGYGAGEVIASLEINENCDFKFYSTNIIQQFTGLKDKDGREIYEGDIVKLHDKRNGDRTGKVYFANGAFLVDKIDCLFYGAKNDVCEDYEIIGNIFENPELKKE